MLLLQLSARFLYVSCSYDDKLDEGRATNLLIIADETFSDVKVSTMGVSFSVGFGLLVVGLLLLQLWWVNDTSSMGLCR